MSSFTSPIGPHLERFLQHKRSLGHRYGREEAHLRAVDRLAASRDDQVVTEELVREFIASGSPGSRPHRLSVIRQVAMFIVVEGEEAFVPPSRFLGVRRRRSPIRILSRHECVRFLDACDMLPGTKSWPERGATHGAALRMLLLTGLRSGEALRLTVDDVDLGAGVIHVVESKFRKSRFVPLAPDLVPRLSDYHAAMGGSARPGSHAFFPGPDGVHRGSKEALYVSFRRVLDIAGIPHGGRGRGPRCHDLRHGFAVLRLLCWYEAGVDVNAKLPLLATYLGHVGVSSLQVYLHMTRDLLGHVVTQQQARFGDLITAEVMT